MADNEENNTVIEINNTQQMQVSMHATATQRYNFAVQHMLSAGRFRRLCYQVEKENAGAEFGPFFEELQSYTTACVLASVAALEAIINEIYIDAIDGNFDLPGLNKNQVDELWQHIEEKSILDKYLLTLGLCERNKMDTGAEPFQSVQTLVRVRNALVHFKPEWHNEQREHAKLSRQLKDKFDLSPFPDVSAPIFPMRCMSHGLTDWAIKSVLSFADTFAQSLAINNRFSKFLHRIND